MVRFLVQRFLVALFRLLVILGILLVVTLIAKWGHGGGNSKLAIGDEFSADFRARILASLRVLAICWTMVMLFGLGIGIFRARLRQAKGLDFIWLPFFALAWAPAFWLVGVVVLWLVEKWGHPGFADGQLPIGEDAVKLSQWWHAMILGVILALGAIGWQFRNCTAGIRDSAKQDFVLSSFMRGHRRSIIFYDHVLKNSMDALTGVIDRGLPATLGMLAMAEWAFRYPGLGQFLIESARAGLPAQMFFGTAIFAAIAVISSLFAEWLLGILDRRVRIS